MAFRDVTFDRDGGLSLMVPFEPNPTGLKVMVRQAPQGVICIDTGCDTTAYQVLLSRILRGLCGTDEPRFVSPIQPLSAEIRDCTQAVKDRLQFADSHEDFCNELAEFIPCGDGEDLVAGARKLRDELVRVKTELAATKANPSGIRVENQTSAALSVDASIGSDGGVTVVVGDSPFGTKPTEPQAEAPRRGRRPPKPKEDPAITNTVTIPKPAAAPTPDVSAHQAAAPPVEPVVVSEAKPMGLTDQLIHLLSEPPLPIGVDPLDDRDQQGNYCDSAFMRLYYRQDVCRSQAIARQAAGYDHKTWRPQKPPEMLVELTDKGAETLADVFFQLNEISGGSIQQLNLWVTLQGSRAAAADAIKAKYAQIRARAKRS